VAEQSDSVPLIPILGVFIAVAHSRFGKMVLFRCGIRLAVVITFGITSILILLYPDIPSVMIKIPEIQRAVMTAFGKDIMYIAPSMIFQVFPASFFLWTGGIIVFALFFCNRRTRSVSLYIRKVTNILAQYIHFREFSFSPCLILIFLLGGSLIIHHADKMLLLPIDKPVHLSRFQEQKEILTNKPLPSKGLFIVSNMTASATVPHKTPVANVIILGQDQRFESFTMKIGKDTSEEALEKPEIKHTIAHGKSAVYRSWNVEAEDGGSFAAHDYYTKFLFSRPLNVQKITLKFLNAESEGISSAVALHIKEIALIQ
jgi:hypothetical protein